MQLIPAIDLKDGRCVRLLKGDFDVQTTYEFDPHQLAQRYEGWGAEWLHLVDLDGAQSGNRANQNIIESVSQSTRLKIQVGGGIRSERELDNTLAVADRAVIGSLAIEQPDQFRDWLTRFGPERLVLALDVALDEQGLPWVLLKGWQERSSMTLAQALGAFTKHGLAHVLCTDVARDGALTGPNVPLYAACQALAPDVHWQASGGISNGADLRELATTGVSGAISGKALLDELIPLEELEPFLPNA